ncbi:hypothetical protein ES705_16434 [subsurface metagenome]
MKKLLLGIIIGLMIVACPYPAEDPEEDDWEYVELAWISREEVQQPYLDKYGDPEEVNEYISDDYHSIDWWWYSKGFMVNFLWSMYSDVHGWEVDHTWLFDPI